MIEERKSKRAPRRTHSCSKTILPEPYTNAAATEPFSKEKFHASLVAGFQPSRVQRVAGRP